MVFENRWNAWADEYTLRKEWELSFLTWSLVDGKIEFDFNNFENNSFNTNTKKYNNLGEEEVDTEEYSDENVTVEHFRVLSESACFDRSKINLAEKIPTSERSAQDREVKNGVTLQKNTLT